MMYFARFSVVAGALLLTANVNAQSTIVQTAVANNFTILAEALTKANLITTLNGTGPFTVFAPTDAAFAAALVTLNITKAQLLNRSDLADILKFHVVSGTVMAANLSNGMSATSLQGSALTISINNPKVKVSGATVTKSDVVCTNGVIHIIDQVLIPPAKTTPTPAPTPAPTSAGLKDLVDTAVAAGKFTILLEAATKAGLGPTLKSTGPFTLFAPTDDAFAAALKTLGVTKAELLARADLANILTYHGVSGLVKSTDLTNGMTPTMLNKAKTTITITGGAVKVNTATVTTADVMCSNGVIHIIDEVLMPPAPAPSGSTAAPSTAGNTEASTAYSAQGLVSLTFGGILSAFLFA